MHFPQWWNKMLIFSTFWYSCLQTTVERRSIALHVIVCDFRLRLPIFSDHTRRIIRKSHQLLWAPKFLFGSSQSLDLLIYWPSSRVIMWLKFLLSLICQVINNLELGTRRFFNYGISLRHLKYIHVFALYAGQDIFGIKPLFVMLIMIISSMFFLSYAS